MGLLADMFWIGGEWDGVDWEDDEKQGLWSEKRVGKGDSEKINSEKRAWQWRWSFKQ